MNRVRCEGKVTRMYESSVLCTTLRIRLEIYVDVRRNLFQKVFLTGTCDCGGGNGTAKLGS